jgi:hypothetical protein
LDFRIKFLGIEFINGEALGFDVCVYLQLHTPTCISLLLNTYPSKTSNHHFLETIQVSLNFPSESNSLNLKFSMMKNLALLYEYVSSYTLLHPFCHYSIFTATTLSTAIP